MSLRYKNDGTTKLSLNEMALIQAKRGLEDKAVTPTYGPWRDDIVSLLNEALATGLVCMLRYKRHHFTARGLSSRAVADEFMAHAHEEAAHADRLARRIAQLGGQPDFSPDGLSRRSHADYDEASNLSSMIQANLIAERVGIEAYRQMLVLIGDKDPTTRSLLEDILREKEEHAHELADRLEST
jgi:bacterioferritin